MTLRQYLILMFSGTTVALVAWIFMLVLVDPRTGGFFAVLMFLATLFLTITGFGSMIGLFLRTAVLRKDEMIARAVSNSFRQALFLALFVDGVLILKSRGTLTPWTTLFFIIFLTLLEFFFVAFRRR